MTSKATNLKTLTNLPVVDFERRHKLCVDVILPG